MKLCASTALAAVLSVTLVGTAASADYPSDTVTIVVPFAAGGGTDNIARLVAEQLSERWGSPVIVENRTGAGGQIGTASVARSAADGHTLVVTVNSHAINASLYPELPYHPTEDFRAVAKLASSPNIVAVNAEVPAHSMQELIDFARANPGELAFGHGGVGVPSHLAGALLSALADVEIIEVAYGGIAPAIMGTIGGEVQIVFAAASGLAQHMQIGTLRPLAVTSATRYSMYPDIPTVNEATGWDNYDVFAWFGMLAPAGTPDEVIEKINAEVNDILQMPSVIERIAALGAVPEGGSAAQFDAYIQSEWEFWDALIKETGISVQ